MDCNPYMYIFTVLPQSVAGVTAYIENRSEMYGLCCDRVQEKGYNGRLLAGKRTATQAPAVHNFILVDCLDYRKNIGFIVCQKAFHYQLGHSMVKV